MCNLGLYFLSELSTFAFTNQNITGNAGLASGSYLSDASPNDIDNEGMCSQENNNNMN